MTQTVKDILEAMITGFAATVALLISAVLATVANHLGYAAVDAALDVMSAFFLLIAVAAVGAAVKVVWDAWKAVKS